MSNGIFTRQNVKDIVGQDFPAESLDKLFALYSSALQGYVSISDRDKAIEDSINKYKADNPAKKVTDSDEYKTLKANYDSLLLDNELRNAKVRNKYIDILKTKIDRTNLDQSLNKARTEFPEFFENDETTSTQSNGKPQITTSVQQTSNTPDVNTEIYNAFLKGMNKN